MQPDSGSAQAMPNQRDLWLIIAGVFVGVLLGPHILGRGAPGLYDLLFLTGDIGLSDVEQSSSPELPPEIFLHDEDVSDGEIRQAVVNALTRQQDNRQEKIDGHLARLQGCLSALIVTVVVIMMAEALISCFQVLNLLRIVRYALLAVWIAITLGQPRLLSHFSIAFVLSLMLICLVAGCLPLPRRQ